MTDPEASSADELRNVMLGMSEQLEPLYEAAEGCRQRLLGYGWSPQAAQALAAQMLSQLLHNAICQGDEHHS